MPAIGFALAWGGYTLMLLGWCKVKGYPTTVADLVVPGRVTTWPPGAATLHKIPRPPGGWKPGPGVTAA